MNVMLDLETLGTKPGCSIVSIGAVAFDWRARKLGPEFYKVIKRTSCVRVGLKECKNTLLWWDNQAEEVKKVLQDSDITGTFLGIGLIEFTDFLQRFGLKEVKLWGNGSDFDNVILSSAYSAIGRPTPWGTYNNRCYRTLKYLHPGIKAVRAGVHHNAIDDAKTQALHAIELLNKIKGL